MNSGEFEEGVSIDEHFVQRYGSILRPARVGERVAALLDDPHIRRASPTAFAAKATSCRSTYDPKSTPIPEEAILND